jgi:hypothetical protein
MKSHRRLLSLLAALLVIGGGVLFLWRTGFFDVRSLNGMQRYIDRFSPINPQLVYFLMQRPRYPRAHPRNLTAAAGALLFGSGGLFPHGRRRAHWVHACLLAGRALGQRFAVSSSVIRSLNQLSGCYPTQKDILSHFVILFPSCPTTLSYSGWLTRFGVSAFSVIVLLTPGAFWWPAGVGGLVYPIPLGHES